MLYKCYADRPSTCVRRTGSGVHVVIVIEIVPIGIIPVVKVVIMFLGLVQVVENPIDHPADGADVLADLFKGANALVVFGCSCF